MDMRSSISRSRVAVVPAWVRIQMLFCSHDFIAVALVTKAYSSFQPPSAI